MSGKGSEVGVLAGVLGLYNSHLHVFAVCIAEIYALLQVLADSKAVPDTVYIFGLKLHFLGVPVDNGKLGSNAQLFTYRLGKLGVKAYELAAERCDYPLHLGVTEAGTERMGIIKSSAGIGALLLHGIGDTIRVSLTADPVKEIYAAHDILKALDIEKDGVQFVSCPTCGRTRIDLVKIANEVEDKLRNCKKNIKVAVMGCVVNGPGEAREADIGIAGGDGCGLVFKKGEILRKVPEDKLVDALLEEVEKL